MYVCVLHILNNFVDSVIVLHQIASDWWGIQVKNLYRPKATSSRIMFVTGNSDLQIWSTWFRTETGGEFMWSTTVKKKTWNYVRFEVFKAVTMKNAVFWYLRTQLLLHRQHITSPLHRPASLCYVRFEVITAVTMNTDFWDIKTQFVLHRQHITSPLQSPAD
jgi:hypothetical protein